ncbi:MAG: flavodoxin family protein [Spirochaetes bacterium]|nr:flavodoxin family protein [Spirochaetota bacterium]
MKVLILNGSKGSPGLNDSIEALKSGLTEKHVEFTELKLNQMKYSPCRGCFNCWVKTPGSCVFKDDGDIICREFITSDLILAAAPLVLGYPAASVKNALDRAIPLVHPYLEEVDGEAHHMKRYGKYPAMAFMLEKESDTDADDMAIVNEIFTRAAINLRSRLAFIKYTDEGIKGVLDEINIH